MAAGLIGFLFGIPRVLQQTQQSPSLFDRSDNRLHHSDQRAEAPASAAGYIVNTNLEQISDWLTKIIVGVGLIEFSSISEAGGRLANALRPGFGDQPSSTLVAGATLAFFSTAGFILSYLLTRTYLTSAFKAFDVEEVAAIATSQALIATETREHQQDEQDALALRLATRQLYGETESVPTADLIAALRGASAVVREQLLEQARNRRETNWDWRKFDHDTERRTKTANAHSRTLPVLEALATVMPDDPRVRAELGYALKDDQHPDLNRSLAELTNAIELAQASGRHTNWPLMNRGIVGMRLGLDPKQVLSDLRAARIGNARVQNIVDSDEEIQEWLRNNGLFLQRNSGIG